MTRITKRYVATYFPTDSSPTLNSSSSLPKPARECEDKMYRVVANRFLHGQLRRYTVSRIRNTSSSTHVQSILNPFSTSATDHNDKAGAITPQPPQSLHDKPIPTTPFNHPHIQLEPQTPTLVDYTLSSAGAGAGATTTDEARRPSKREFPDEQTRVLQASLSHVLRLGWTEAAMMAGARQVGLSPSIVGSFPRKQAALVEFFMDDCLERLIDIIESNVTFKNYIVSERISKLVKARLEMQAPYISKWPQALSIQAQPLNIPTSFKQRAMLIDEIWHAVGDEASDLDWYVKRTILGGIYSTTEIYMLTDSSPGFCDTWAFLNDRVRDAFDLKKSIQEASYLAQAVGAGMGGSLEGFMRKAFR